MSRLVHPSLIARVAILFVLYPWLVSFDKPHDSASNSISIYGGTGQYDHITRDCSGKITSVTPIPYYEAAASYEEPVGSHTGLRLRAGYLTANNKHMFFDEAFDSISRPISTLYAGGQLRFNWPFFGLDVGALAFDRPNNMTSGTNFAPVAQLRFGWLNAWYVTLGMLENDPIVSGPAVGTLGLGFDLATKGEVHPGQIDPSLWLGLGLFPYDGALFCGALRVPLSQFSDLAVRAGISTAANFEGSASFGLTTRF